MRSRRNLDAHRFQTGRVVTALVTHDPARPPVRRLVGVALLGVLIAAAGIGAMEVGRRLSAVYGWLEEPTVVEREE